jgi:hypothetical protein
MTIARRVAADIKNLFILVSFVNCYDIGTEETRCLYLKANFAMLLGAIPLVVLIRPTIRRIAEKRVLVLVRRVCAVA